MLQLISIFFWVERCVWTLQRRNTHSSTIMRKGLISAISLFLTKCCRSTWDLWFQQFVSEFLDLIDFIFLCNQKTKVWVFFSKFFKLDCDWSYAKLLLELSAAVLKGLIVQKNYIRPGKLFSGLSWNSYIKILIKGGSHQLQLILLHNFNELLFSFQQSILTFILRLSLVAELNACIVFIKFDLMSDF